MDVETLGPAERIIQTIIQWTGHAVHNRPGLVTPDDSVVGAKWQQATWKREGDDKVVYTVRKVGRKQQRTRVGVGVQGTDEVRSDSGRVIGRFMNPGLFPEVVGYLYEQIAAVWQLDNEFAARWASWAYANEDNRDLKVMLAAFMLVQSRFGEPIKEDDETLFDEDHRTVGEAMCLTRSRKKGYTFNPKLLLRVGDVLALPAVIEANRRLGFGQTGRNPIVGRYTKVVERWLRQMEMNVKLFEKLVKQQGFRTQIMELARRVGYKPLSEKFFEILRWKQAQAKDGRRRLAIGKEVSAADSWDALDERQICERIMEEKPGYKVIVGKLPAELGLTPAIMAAAVEAGALSDQDLIILTPTLEELGLLENAPVEQRWKAAMERAENQRAQNVAKNVKSRAARESLEQAAEQVAAKAVEEVARDLRFYIMVDISGSMEGAIEQAKIYLAKFVGAFPLDRIHVSVFNTVGREVTIKKASAAGVTQAFRGYSAGGGTDYSQGLSCLAQQYTPGPEEDSILIFIGDQEDSKVDALMDVVRRFGLDPVAFGLLHVVASAWGGAGGTVVEEAAARLGLPCFKLEEQIFDDVYAVPRTLRNIIAATPVKKAGKTGKPRVSLVDQILATPLLQKPAWA